MYSLVMCHVYAFTFVLLVFTRNSVLSEGLVSTRDYPCTKDADCKSYIHNGVVRCSVCADTSSGNGLCLFPFPYMFQTTSNLLCNYINPCPLSCSTPKGDCRIQDKYPLAYVPSCRCYFRFYGPECQYEAPATANLIPSQYITWLFKGFIPVSDVTELEFSIWNYWNPKYSDTELTLNTSEGYFIRKSKWKDFFVRCYNGEENCKTLTVTFPYSLFNFKHFDKFITLNDKVVGYYAEFTILVIDLGVEVYKRKFKIIVSYENKVLKCIASIKLRNCSPSHDTPTIFTRPTGIDFESEVFYVADGGYISTSIADEGCSNDNLFTWKMWSFTGEEETTPPLFEIYTIQAWRFNPYSLEIGVYKVLFEVQHANNLAKNFAYCYFRVTALPLIVRIDGGSDRMIKKNDGLVLSAVRSSDPNMPTLDQKDLMVEWSCKIYKSPSKINPACNPVTMSAASPYFIPPELLMYSTIYNFTLKLWSTKYLNCDGCGVVPQYGFVNIQVGHETLKKSISIHCVQNCEYIVRPNEPLFLKVTSKNINVTKANFEWKFFNSSNTEQSLDSFKVKNMPQFMLLLEEGFFDIGKKYTISVRSNVEGTYASYEFVTDILKYNESCEIEPQNGTKGLTEFDITCPLMNDYALIYEFYDKYHDDIMSTLSTNGRMLGTTFTGKMHNVKLARGYVVIFIINSRGVSVKQNIKVELSDSDNKPVLISDLKKNLTDSLIYFNDERRVVGLSSLIADILPIKEEHDFKFLLRSLFKITLDTFPMVKMVSSALYTVLTHFNTPDPIKLEPDFLIEVLDLINKLTYAIRQFVFHRKLSQYTPLSQIKEIAEANLQCFSIILKCRGNKTIDVDSNEFTLTDQIELRQGSCVVGKTVDNLKDILTLIQHPGKPPIQVSTAKNSMKVWTLTSDKQYPITSYLGNEIIPVSISDTLMNSLTRKTNNKVELSLRSADISDSHLLLLKSDINSNLVSVSLALLEKEKDLSYIHFLQHPINIHLTMNDVDLENTKVEGSVMQADSSLHQDYLDNQIKIHRLDIKPRSCVSIIFLYPPTDSTFRVSVSKDYRPDFQYMTRHATVISSESSELPYYYIYDDEPIFLYMGIMPGKEVPVNQSVNYSFNVSTTLCQHWSKGLWKSEDCMISRQTEENKVVCQCYHLSIFGVAFLVPPHKVDPYADAKLFLTVFDNQSVVALVVTVLVLYFLLCIYLCHVDKKDKKKISVVVLKDNFSFDRYPYLLAVFTGSRLSAGTTAHVGVKLIGSDSESRAHILTNSGRKVLHTGNDDWFLIYCPEHLGDIQNLHLWHDNAGWSPSWYCENVFIYDLTEKTETKFVIKEWLDVRYIKQGNILCYPETVVMPTKEEDILSVKPIFFENFILGIRDGHKVMSVFYRHPRSHVTRVQRFSIIIVFLMVAMLGSIMYYNPSDEDTVGIDDYFYSVGIKEIVISIQILILTTGLACILSIVFKRSMKFKHLENNRFTTLINRHYENLKIIQSPFIRHLTSILKSEPLYPIQFPNNPQIVKIRWVWYMLAWISCITIILVCGYFVMLYGLKLGPVNSQKWLTSMLLVMGEDSLIFGPTKIFVSALVLSLAFQHIVDVNTYQISNTDLYHNHLYQEDDEIGQKLLERKRPMYAPLSMESRESILGKTQMVSDWWTFVEFVISTAFVLVTCNITYLLWSSHYHSNSHILAMMANTKYSLINSIDFFEISNVKQLDKYLSNTFINIIYNVRWNEKNVDYQYFTPDLTNMLVGCPKIRQLRMQPFPCNNSVIPKVLCIPEWNEPSEDTDVYSKEWGIASYIDVQKQESYWIYKDKSSSFKSALLRFYGPSGRLFHDGGYSVTLGPTRLDAEQTLDDLSLYGWQDKRTRVVFVELTTFNCNTALFSQTTLMVEYLVSGAVLLKARTTSVSIIFNAHLMSCLFVACLIFFIVRTIYFINVLGFFQYLMSGFGTITQITIIVVGIMTIMQLCVHLYAASDYTKQFQHLGYEKYFEYDALVYYFVLMRITIFLLLTVSIIPIIGAISSRKSLVGFVYSLISSLKHFYCITLLSLFTFIVLQCWTYILYISSFTLKEMLLNGRSLKFVTFQDLKYDHIKLFIIFKMILIYIINKMFLFVILYNIRVSKLHTFRNSQMFQLLNTYCIKIINKINIIKYKITKV